MKRGIILSIVFAISTLFIYAEPLRVMTFNIRYNNPEDGINAWPHRKQHVANMISAIHKADTAGLQEVKYDQLMDLVNLLPDTYSYVGVGRGDGWQDDEYSCIFFRNDKLELIATNTFWLAENPEIPGMVSWDSAITRIVTWAKFKDKASGKEFFHFNTHFDHRGREARVESAKLIVNKTRSIAGDVPCMITGDFNARESSAPYAVLSGKEPAGEITSDLKDGRYISKNGHEGPTASTTNWNEMGQPETRIDYIFIRNGFEVLSHKVLDDRFDGRFPSDHLPVLAEIQFSN